MLFPKEPIFAENCYLQIESAGNFDPIKIESIAVSLVSKYLGSVIRIPLAGISLKECAYIAGLTESMAGFQFSISGNGINTLGISKITGINGATIAILRAIYNSKNDDQLKNRICKDFLKLLAEDCKKVEAVILFFNENGQVIPDGATVSAGEPFYILIQPLVNLYANIINKDSRGNIFRIFPNKEVTNASNPLKANTNYFFPPRESPLIFKFDGTIGIESFFIIISPTPVHDIDNLISELKVTASDEHKEKISKILENQIVNKGVALGEKIIPIKKVEWDKKLPPSGKLLTKSGAFVKVIRLKHL